MIHICGGCLADAPRSINQWRVADNAHHGICSWCGALAEQSFRSGANDPIVAANGVMGCSTSLVLDRVRPIIWDVNGYYRRIGVATDASRSEIRDRFIEIQGHRDEYTTWIVKVLLSKPRRAKYDACQPGDLFWDPIIERFVKEQARSMDRGQPDLDQVFDPHDLEIGAEELLGDPEPDLGEDRVVKTHHPLPPPSSGWGWYVWRCGVTEENARLASEWRLLVSLEARDLGLPMPPICIGIGRDLPWDGHLILKLGHGYWTLFFDQAMLPTREVAEAAAHGLHRSIQAATLARAFAST